MWKFIISWLEARLDRYKRMTDLRTCPHKWEFYYENRVKREEGSSDSVNHTLMCKKCGAFKQQWL